MQQKFLVTIIVPVYNTSAYLHRCITSIINQTYKQLEIILVDDGSTDESPRICEDYAKKDCRVKVIHKTNGGLSSSRNTGLDHATGEWITFVDSDDWIANDTVQFCADYISTDDSIDVVQYAIKEVYTKADESVKQDNCCKKYNSKKIREVLLYESISDDSWFSCCRCLFKRAIIGGIRFREGKVNEDIDFKYHVFQNANIVLDCSARKYFYFKSRGSITTVPLRKRDLDLYEAAQELIKLVADDKDTRMLNYAEIKYKKTSLSLLCKAAYYGISDEFENKMEIIKTLRKRLKNDLVVLLRSPMKKSRKILAVGFSINYSITKLCIQTAKRIVR